MTNETTPVEPSMIAAETMLGDLMSAIIDEVKAVEMPWHLTPKRDQEDLIERTENRVRAIVARVVEIIASGARPTITVTLDSVTVKDGIKAQVTMSRAAAQRHDLIDAQGSQVLLVVMNGVDYSGGTKPKAQSEQRRLPLGGEGSEGGE